PRAPAHSRQCAGTGAPSRERWFGAELRAPRRETTLVRLYHGHAYNEMLTAQATRILALDLGKRRIGLAISDPLGITAQGLPKLVRTNKRADLEALGRIAAEREAGMVLLGNPVNMRGHEGRQSGWGREFAPAIEQ